MLLSKICIIIGGILTLLLAIFHSRFYALFNWKDEFKNVSKPNQRIFFTINMALVILFSLFSIFTFVYSTELAQPHAIGIGILIIFSIFWGWRTIWQIFYFRIPKEINFLDKRLFMHYIMIFVYSILTLCYCIPLFIL